MSSPGNPNQRPGRPTGNPPGNSSGGASGSASGSPSEWQGAAPDDPTRTQWLPAQDFSRPSSGAQAPGAPRVSPTEPTLTQWTASATPPVDPYTPPAPAQQVPQQAPQQTPQQTPGTRKSARRGPRSFFWPGFAVGFLLLSAISCGVVTAALGLNRLTLDDIRGSTGAAWTPMPVTPTAALAAAPQTESDAAPDAVSTRFSAGQAARNITNSRVNIRMTPGYLGKAGSDVIGQLEVGQALTILGEPTTADELTWWRIQADNSGQAVVGWVAEATASGVQILGATP